MKNINSITDYLQTLNHTLPVSVIAFSETWFGNDNNPPPLTHINGYTIAQSDRLHKRGGGVAFIYISNYLNFRIRKDLRLPWSTSYESIFIEIENKPRNNIVGIVYRATDSPVHPFLEYISKCTEIISKEKKSSIYICGDFNLDLMKSHIHSPTAKFLDYMYSSSIFSTY